MMINPSKCAETDGQVLLLTGLLPSDTSRSCSEQTRNVLERMETALQNEGMNFSHIVRTWFHLNDILDWYGEFNTARIAFFNERNVFSGVVPASTGVGISNLDGAALVSGLLAVKPRSARVKVLAVPSPLQCSPSNYGSAFSRAVEMQVPGQRYLYISGTASIDEKGAGAYCGDIDGQINLSMTVVRAILESRNMTWADTNRAIAYFKNLRFAPRFTAYCRSHGFSELMVTPVQATMCREELLFEVEVDAVTNREAP